MPDMIVFSTEISSRLTYVLNYIFKHRLGIAYKLETNPEAFTAALGVKLNYSNWHIENTYQIVPNGLLFENRIVDRIPDVEYTLNEIMLFPTERGHSPFDIFSAIFFMLTRYEEYQNYNADAHGRFPASESLAFKHNFLNRPVVDEWIMAFKQQLLQIDSNLLFKEEKYSVNPTIDVDSPWCYKNKGLVRNVGGFFRDALKLNFKANFERIFVVLGLRQDAHFQFDWLNQLFKRLNLTATFFIHVGNYGHFDKSIDYHKRAFISFIQNLKKSANVGVHPSYQAAINPKLIKAELARLSEITGERIIKSRQHYLKFTLPEYYEILADEGVTDDYSMGFADSLGFRAGTSRPFPFYNLKSDQETELQVHPFCVMDRTLNTYQNISPENALEPLNEIIVRLKQANGSFVILWHNESLSNRMEWKGWRIIFEQMLINAIR